MVVLGRAIDGVPPPAGTTRSDVVTGLAAGLLAGVGVLVRPAMLFFLLARRALAPRRQAVGPAGRAGRSRPSSSSRPWTVRNYREYGRLVLVASEGGLTFWTGNHPLSPGEGDLAANPAIKVESRRLRAAHPGLTEEQLEPIYYREALRAIRDDPAWWAGLLARKALLHDRAGRSVLYSSLAAVSCGVHRCRTWSCCRSASSGSCSTRRRGTWPRALVMLAASAVLVCLVFLPQERFRISGIDPALVVFAAAWWALRADRRPLI